MGLWFARLGERKARKDSEWPLDNFLSKAEGGNAKT
jgi:hypothetical protein